MEFALNRGRGLFFLFHLRIKWKVFANVAKFCCLHSLFIGSIYLSVLFIVAELERQMV